MERGKRFVERYRHGFPKKSQGRYSTKMHFCTVILLMAMVLGICTMPDLLLGQWQNTEASAADVWDGSTATDWTGSGTETDPYIITTAAQLAGLAQSVNGGTTYSGKYFKLANDLDLNGSETQQWTPIGLSSSSSYYYFQGNFDGDGHTISNLYINGDSYRYAGLFGCISNATISNLKVSGSINNTYSSATSSTGGIVGYSSAGSTIEYCNSSVTVSASNAADNMFVGGITGMLFGSSAEQNVKYCYNTGSVTATQTGSYFSSAGGIVGAKSTSGTGNIIGCYNTGTIKAVGGTNGSAYAGGLCGINRSTLNVNYSYNVGTVSAEGTETKIGGLVAGNEENSDTINITNSYWLSTCGASEDYSDGTTDGKKTAEQLWSDEVLNDLNSSTDYGEIYEADQKWENNGFPVLKWSTVTDAWDGSTATDWTGSGTQADPYIITTAAQLAGFARSVNGGTTYSGKYIKLGNDIDLGSEQEWTPIGYSRPFQGNFDGDGHTVTNLYINKIRTRAGLFGDISGAKIRNLSVSGSIEMIAPSGYAGGIVGSAINSSTIEYCDSSVEIDIYVNRYINAGGIVGYLNSNSNVKYCYNTSRISTTSMPDYGSTDCSSGGIVGVNGSSGINSIIGCYNRGYLSFNSNYDSIYVGGLCGINQGTLNVKYSYVTGSIQASTNGTVKKGGLVASNEASDESDAIINITNSYYTAGGVSEDYSGGTTDGKKTTAELKGDEVLALLNAGGAIYRRDIQNINDGYPVILLNIKFDVVYIDSTNGNDGNPGTDASSAVKTMNVALIKLNPGGTIKVCSTITMDDGDTINLDGTDLISESGQKATIEENTEGLEMFSLWGGHLTVTNLNFKGSGTSINCEDTASLSLSNVEFSGTGTSIESTGTVNVSGKVVIPKISLSSTTAKITGANALTSGSSIAIQGAGNDHKVVEGSMSSAQKGYFTVADSGNNRLVTKGESNALYYYKRPTWSVNINTDTPGQIILTPTLTNFVDGDYGDKLTISVEYPDGANSFTMNLDDIDSVGCKFKFNSGAEFTKPSDSGSSITLASTHNGQQQILYCYSGSPEPKYAGTYTGTVRFEGTLTEAT